ncbi:hypothetical protein CAP35_13020 [Chitinophagaceae bacterium IBVUCB1]|nr:hypothetical protein CAP35_13020 [Chitinophagaceae bacterium IBVUCB1]
MPAAALKDYYQTLEVPPSATPDEIKKAYRTLAFKYHPDANPDNAFAHQHFLEIQEAYTTLSHEHKRRKYDEERWLNGMSHRANAQPAATPQWLLQEAQRLHTHMQTIDTYRMSHTALHDYVLLLLSDSHMAILQKEDDNNTSIVQLLLQSTRHLKHPYMQVIANRLALLVPAHNDMLIRIYQQQRRSYRHALWQQYLPIVILLITLLLCGLMVVY